jgi:O-antigen/teichoic acid export membrane protein
LSTKANVIANYVGQIWRAAIGLLFIPIYIKYLGIEAYGLMSIFAMLQAWLVLLDLGMRPTLSREMARYTAGVHNAQSIRDLLRSVETIAITTAAFIAFLMWLASSWMATRWLTAATIPTPVLSSALSLIGIVLGFRFVESVYASTIVGLQRQVVDNAISVSMATLRGVGAIGVLAYISPTIEAFFVWQAVVSLITVVLYMGFAYRSLPASQHPAQFSLPAVINIGRFAMGMTLISSLALLLTQVDKLFLSRMLTLKSFSYYALAATIANSLYLLVAPITTAFYPRFTELVATNDAAGLRLAYHQAAQFVTVAMGAAAIILIFFSDRILYLWTGDPILTHQAAPLLSLLAFGTFLNALMWVPYQIQLAHGWTALIVKTNIAAVLILVPAIIWFVPKYGAIAAAWIWMTLNGGYLIFLIFFMHRRIMPTEKWGWYRNDLIKPSLVAFMIGAICRWVMPDRLGKFSEFIALLAIGALVVAAGAVVAPDVRKMILNHLPIKIKQSAGE